MSGKVAVAVLAAAVLAALGWFVLRSTPEAERAAGPPAVEGGADASGTGPKPPTHAPPTPTPPVSPVPGASGPSSGVSTATVTGTVVPRGGGKGIVGVPVRVLRRNGTAGADVTTVTTGDGGAFRVEGLTEGDYRLVPGAASLPANERSEEDVSVPRDAGKEVVLELEALDESIAVRVHGTVTFDSGRIPARFSFDFWKFDGNRHINCLVEGTDGKFTKRLPFAGKFAVTSMKADGEDLDYLFQEVEVTEGADIALVVEEAREAGVLVVDEAEGQPVVGARVHRAVKEEDMERHVAPGLHNPPGPNTRKATPLRTDATGRVSLGRGRGEQEVWVIADGFAWSRADVKFAKGEFTRVGLVPGGTVRLRIEDWSRLQEPSLHAWPIAAGRPEDDAIGIPMQLPDPDSSGDMVLDGMPVGHFLLEVLRGPWFKHGEVYGKAGVDVTPGGTATVSIRTTPPPKSVPVEVLIAVGAGWPEPPSRLLLGGLDPGNADVYQFTQVPAPLEGREYRLRTEPVPPGRYRVEVSPQGWTGEVAVAEGGGSLRLEIPPPGTLVLLVKNATTGEAERSAVARWTANPEQGAPDVQALPNEGPGRFRLLVPQGTVRLLVSGTGLRSQAAEVQGTPGATVEKTVVLQVSATLTVRLTLDGRPFTGEARASLAEKKLPADPAEAARHIFANTKRATATGGELTFTDFDEGEWVLKVDAQAMKRVPPRDLRIGAATPVQIEVPLEREDSK